MLMPVWMTSSSELFHSRRYRFGVRHNSDDVSGIASSSPDSTSHQHRTANRRHNHPNSGQNTRREHRHDLDGCDPASRRNHRRRTGHSELDPEQGLSQSPSGSIINSNDFRSIQRRRATGSDRLPGSVLLARERLVERLRGISVSGNRQTSGSSSNTHQDDFPSSRNSSLTGYDDNFLETRVERVEDLASESWPASFPTSSSQETIRLQSDELNCLPLEIYTNDGKNDESSSAGRECTICLEGFQDGDKLIRLNCMHRFHSSCLLPWVRVSGCCPNCRKTIIVLKNNRDSTRSL